MKNKISYDEMMVHKKKLSEFDEDEKTDEEDIESD